jgi:hypothetical protein
LLKASRAELAEALTGRFNDHHGFLAKVHLDLIDSCKRPDCRSCRTDRDLLRLGSARTWAGAQPAAGAEAVGDDPWDLVDRG